MLELRFSKESPEIVQIKERLLNLTLAHKVLPDSSVDTPSLVDGKQEYRGIDKMNAYLDVLDSEKEQLVMEIAMKKITLALLTAFAFSSPLIR